MNNVAFFHNQVGPVRSTFYFRLPSKQELINLVNNCKTTLTCVVGQSFVHPQDQFNKRIGRSVATAVANPLDLVLICISPLENGRLGFSFEMHGKIVDMSIVKTSENVHLEGVV